MVGFRVFDVGLLVLWLVWFFRLRDDEDEEPGDDGPGGGGPGLDPKDDPGGGGLGIPLGEAKPGGRLRGGHRPKHSRPRRGVEPMPRPAPARVRQPSPGRHAPTHRRTG